MEWTLEGLASAGFKGFVTFADLPFSSVPHGQGVYVVLRDRVDRPTFLDVGPAGRFKGKDPTVDPAILGRAWVEGARVLYIGKGSAGATGRGGPAKRLDEFGGMALGVPWVTGVADTSGNCQTAMSCSSLGVRLLTSIPKMWRASSSLSSCRSGVAVLSPIGRPVGPFRRVRPAGGGIVRRRRVRRAPVVCASRDDSRRMTTVR